jgi:shikimate dehydrogenase
MQNAALAELGLAPQWTYEAIEVAPPDFEALVRELPGDGFAGVNVTVPHKLAALAIADAASEAARAIGAANMLSFTPGGVEAENTDAAGLIGALPRPPAGSRALVLGAGGSARACAWALREADAQVSIWNRTEERAQALATALGVAAERRAAGEAPIPPGRFDLIVNCTTIGLAEAGHPPADAPALGVLPIDADSLSTETVVIDLVYGAHPTPLTCIARDRGARVVDGLDVLVHQGADSLRLWTGREPPLETMRRAARAEPQA